MLETERKALGAYYTDSQVADFLVWWAVRHGTERVMDPCFGGGVFLRAACQRVESLGGVPAAQVYGVELDQGVHQRISEKLRDEFSVSHQNLVRSDFFDVSPVTMPQPDVIVGNPPFIRYQRFSGEDRAKALAVAHSCGVRLSALSSSWAPFLVHCISMLADGGRLAMVMPAEIGHAGYALPALGYLFSSFRNVIFLTFRKRLFPDLSEDTILLLAAGRGLPHETTLWRDFENAGSLSSLTQGPVRDIEGLPIDSAMLASGALHLTQQFVPEKTGRLYHALRESLQTKRLGLIADVGIGYVTGANDFFHLTEDTVRSYRIPRRYLRRVVRRGRDLAGAFYTEADWQSAAERGDGVYLLRMQPDELPPPWVRSYIKAGEAAGANKAYKCRIRTPWYSVPHVREADAFLSYMSGGAPRLVSNECEAVAPNSLHVLRLHGDSGLTRRALASLWSNSLTRLSCELEGHSLGGGMLKLEPTEAERVLLPVWNEQTSHLEHLAREMDRLDRAGRSDEALSLADRVILREGLGLSATEVKRLRDAADDLRHRRCTRGTPS